MSALKRQTADLDAGTRAKLVDAAGKVFAESGYRGATIREICAGAGVNVALVNYYFGDKLELYAEVLRESIGSLRGEFKVFESGLAPEKAIPELIRATLQRIFRSGRPGWHYQLMVHEMAQPTPAMASVINETMKPLYDRFRALIGQMLMLSPEDDEVRLCAHSVIAQVVHYAQSRFTNSLIWPELELTPARVEQIGTHIADFSLAYLQLRADRLRPHSVHSSATPTNPARSNK